MGADSKTDLAILENAFFLYDPDPKNYVSDGGSDKCKVMSSNRV